jgi:hypothetical protein
VHEVILFIFYSGSTLDQSKSTQNHCWTVYWGPNDVPII